MSLWSRIKNVFYPDRHHQEIREELEFHLEMDRLNGHDKREARLRLGNMSGIAEETRSAGIVGWLESVLQDIRYGIRQLRKSPAWSLAIVSSLAIGLGANSAIFALVDAALLKPLPVADPDQLVMLEWSINGRPPFVGRFGGGIRTLERGRQQFSTVSEAVYREFAAQQSVFASVIGFSGPGSMTFSDGGITEQVRVQYVSTNFFAGLGVYPILGRPFLEDDDRRGQAPAVIVSHRYWTGRLGGDPAVLGRNFRMNNALVHIVGVAPPGFYGLSIGEWVDVYAPLSVRFASPPPSGENADWWLRQAARLQPGSSASASALQATRLFRSLAAQTTGSELRPDVELVAEPGRRGFQSGVGNNATAAALRILMLLVGLLLLIVCANVANLLLSRALAGQRESAIRLALGAARIRLFRQQLISSGMLALLGGFAGVGLGYLLAQAIHEIFQSGRGAGSAFDLQPDWRLLAYTMLLSAVTALVFGLAPALRAARSSLNETLKVQSRSVIGRHLRLPRLLVSMQLALCFAALVAAGLLGRSLQNLNSVDLGFDDGNLAYATIDPFQAGYTQAQVASYLDRLKQQLAAIPGVQDVAVLDMRPLQGGGRGAWASTPEGPAALLGDGRPNPAAAINLMMSDIGLLETLRVRMLAGRALAPRDSPGTPVAVVDQRFAEVFFNGRNPVGEHFTLFRRSWEVIGMAANARFLDVREQGIPTVYFPFNAKEFLPGPIHIAFRSAIGPDQLSTEVRRVVASVDRAVPVTEFHTQSGLIDRELRTERLLAFLSGGFGLIALILAAIGLGGLLAYVVARRTSEIGVRMALGAAPADVIRMVLRDSLSMIVFGLLIGFPAAYIVARFLQASLFELQAIDPVSTGFAVVMLLLVAVTAALLPARRAARVDPVTALREE
jgi:predicted permease